MKPPDELKSLSDWPNFQDQMVSYLAHNRSSKTGVPLSYVGRDHDIVTDEMRADDYDSIDLDLYNTALLTGPQYNLDRQRVFDLVKRSLLMGLHGPMPAVTSATRMVAA